MLTNSTGIQIAVEWSAATHEIGFAGFSLFIALYVLMGFFVLPLLTEYARERGRRDAELKGKAGD